MITMLHIYEYETILFTSSEYDDSMYGTDCPDPKWHILPHLDFFEKVGHDSSLGADILTKLNLTNDYSS